MPEFEIVSDFNPTGDRPEAIAAMLNPSMYICNARLFVSSDACGRSLFPAFAGMTEWEARPGMTVG